MTTMTTLTQTTDISALVGILQEADTSLEGFARQAFKAERHKQGTIPFEEIARLRAMYAKAKLPVAHEHVVGLLEAGVQKVLVFGHHLFLLDGLDALFQADGYQTIKITGDVPVAERQALVDRFQSDPNIRVAVLGIRAASEGLTLTAASTVVFAEVDWTFAKTAQAEDRVHRIGQTADMVQIQYLTFDRTLDASMLHAIVAKAETAEKILDRDRKVSIDEAAAHAERLAEAKYTAPAQKTGEYRAVGRDRTTNEMVEIRLSQVQVDAIHAALLRLAGMCDGARSQDQVGFNGRDTDFGHSLAEQVRARGQLSPGQYGAALRMLRTYSKTQIADLAPVIWKGKA